MRDKTSRIQKKQQIAQKLSAVYMCITIILSVGGRTATLMITKELNKKVFVPEIQFKSNLFYRF